jgi:hypothetical protein
LSFAHKNLAFETLAAPQIAAFDMVVGPYFDACWPTFVEIGQSRFQTGTVEPMAAEMQTMWVGPAWASLVEACFADSHTLIGQAEMA